MCVPLSRIIRVFSHFTVQFLNYSVLDQKNVTSDLFKILEGKEEVIVETMDVFWPLMSVSFKTRTVTLGILMSVLPLHWKCGSVFWVL